MDQLNFDGTPTNDSQYQDSIKYLLYNRTLSYLDNRLRSRQVLSVQLLPLQSHLACEKQLLKSSTGPICLIEKSRAEFFAF